MFSLPCRCSRYLRHSFPIASFERSHTLSGYSGARTIISLDEDDSAILIGAPATALELDYGPTSNLRAYCHQVELSEITETLATKMEKRMDHIAKRSFGLRLSELLPAQLEQLRTNKTRLKAMGGARTLERIQGIKPSKLSDAVMKRT